MSFLDNLFGGGDETYVGTSVTRVIKDDGLPNAIRSGVIKSLFYNGDISDYIAEEVVSSVGVRADRLYSYAKSHYVNGLPSGQTYSSTQGRQQVEAVIEQIEGRQVAIQYSHYGAANALHVAWIVLINQYGYDPVTNEITGLRGGREDKVYLQDIVIQVPASRQATINPQVLETWGTAANGGYTPYRLASDLVNSWLSAPTPPDFESGTTQLQALVSYCWAVRDEVRQETLIIPLTGDASKGNYFQAKYTVNGLVKYWVYQHGTGTYPLLDNVYVDAPDTSGDYFPFIYFRFDKTQINKDTSTDEYKTSRNALKKLGMSIDDVADAIAENPDIGNVEQAFLTFALPATSTNAIECRYLFEYFDNLHLTQDGYSSSLLQAILTARLSNQTYPMHTIVLKDKKLRISLSNDGIGKSLVAGSIGSIGTHTATVVGTRHYYRKQIVEGLYEQLEVENLKMQYYIVNGYSTTSDGNENILLIPVDRTFSETYSIPEREELYSRSMHVVFNSRVVQHVAWYQTSLFQLVMIVIAVAMTIADYGTDGGSWISAALGLTGEAGLLATIIFTLAVGQLVPMAFRVFVKALGKEVAEALALVAIVYGAYRLASEGVSFVPTASKLLQLSNGLMSAVLSSKMQDLREDADRFGTYVEEQTKLLETAEELLKQDTLLQPFVIYGEKPEAFYNRTIHFGNIGTLGITAVASYVDIALTLPKINDTLGETIYDLA